MIQQPTGHEKLAEVPAEPRETGGWSEVLFECEEEGKRKRSDADKHHSNDANLLRLEARTTEPIDPTVQRDI